MLDRDVDRQEVSGPERDGVSALGDPPPIVSISDVHGYLDEAESALLAVGQAGFDPVVYPDGDGLHWAGNDYVLVVNGDLVDRGPDNEATLRTVDRLRREAPPGRVRVTVGNHEMSMLLPAVVRWPRWYSGRIAVGERRAMYERIVDGGLVAAYEGHAHAYAHAGRPSEYEAAELNDRLREAAGRLQEAAGTPRDEAVQEAVHDDYPALFGLGGEGGRGPGAGVCWLDFSHLPADAPPQVVGHTRHDEPTRKGNVVCQNVIRNNRRTPGGEAALVKAADRLVAVVRTGDEGVETRDLSLG